MKLNLSFGECEHGGDIETYEADLRGSGAEVTDWKIEEETGHFELEVEDLPSFLSSFRETESFEYCNLA